MAGASFFSGYPGILARVFSAIISSRLLLSWRFTSTLSAVRLQANYLAFHILHLFRCSIAASMRLYASSSFVSFHRFVRDFHLQLFLFLSSFLAHCTYGRFIFILLYQSLSLC